MSTSSDAAVAFVSQLTRAMKGVPAGFKADMRRLGCRSELDLRETHKGESSHSRSPRKNAPGRPVEKVERLFHKKTAKEAKGRTLVSPLLPLAESWYETLSEYDLDDRRDGG